MTKKISTAIICIALSAIVAVAASSPKTLEEMMISNDAAVRRQAAQELRGFKKISKKLTPVVLKGCGDTDEEVRMHAYYAIQRADPRVDGVVAALRDGMIDTSLHVRRAAITSIAKMNPFPSAVLSSMGKLLFDKDEVVRREAFTTFVDISRMEGLGVGAIIRMLGNTNDDEERILLAKILETIGPDAKNAAPQMRLLMKSKNPQVKEAGERALTSMGMQ